MNHKTTAYACDQCREAGEMVANAEFDADGIDCKSESRVCQSGYQKAQQLTALMGEIEPSH
jgi:hypothetical protein